MSINDPLVIRYSDLRCCFYVTQGNETFFDDGDNWITFGTATDAKQWCKVMKPGLEVIDNSGYLDPRAPQVPYEGRLF